MWSNSRISGLTFVRHSGTFKRYHNAAMRFLFLILSAVLCLAGEFRLSISGGMLSVQGEAAQYVIQSATTPAAIEINEIVFDGDSLTSGGTWIPKDMTYPNQLMRMCSNWTALNWSVSGQSGANMLSNFWTHTGKSFNPAKKQAVVFAMGANDLLNEKVSAETMVARHVAYFSNCVAAGYLPQRVFIRPISTRANPGFPEQTRQAVNATLTTIFPANFLPVESEPRIYGLNAQVNNPNLFADMTHPNAIGAGLEAAAFYAFISKTVWIDQTNLTANFEWAIPSGTRFYRAISR